MKAKKTELIKCPRCKAEYLPAEIFIPNEFFGKPEDIERDNSGRQILNFYGKPMDTIEHYYCDCCNTPFKVFAKIQFFTEEEPQFNFEEEYSSKLKSMSLFLQED